MSPRDDQPRLGEVGSRVGAGSHIWKVSVGPLAVLGYAVAALVLELLFAYLIGGMVGGMAVASVIPFALLVLGLIGVVIGAGMWIASRHTPPSRFRRRGIGMVLAGIVAVVPFPWLREMGRDITNRILCGYGLAHRHYFIQADKAGNYPPDIHAALARYPHMEYQGFCPSEPPASLPDAFVYIPNQTERDDPRNILLYEHPGRHPGGGHVVYLGSGYEWIEPYSHVLELVEQTKQRLATRDALSGSAPAVTVASRPAP